MHENEIARIIVDCSFKVHTAFGPGLIETVYQAALLHELKKLRLSVSSERGIPVIYDEIELGIGFRADIIVENKVIVEIKSVD